MAVVGIKVTALEPLKSEIHGEDIFYIAKKLYNEEFVSLKATFNDLSSFIMTSRVEGFVEEELRREVTKLEESIEEARVYAKDLVDAEAVARETADNVLKNYVDTQDNKLQNKIEAEELKREEEDIKLLEAIQKEVSDRHAEVVLFFEKGKTYTDSVAVTLTRDIGTSLDASKSYTDSKVLTLKNETQAEFRTSDTKIQELKASLEQKEASLEAKINTEKSRTDSLISAEKSRVDSLISAETIRSDNKFVEKVAGKSLSTNDFDNSSKQELLSLRLDLTSLIEEEEDRSEATYVAKAPNKQLSTLSFEKDDKDLLYSLEDKARSFTLQKSSEDRVLSDSKYVPITTGKQLSTLSFELEHRDKILSNEHNLEDEKDLRVRGDQDVKNQAQAYTDTAINNAITPLTDIYVKKEVGKGLSDNNFTSSEKTKLAGLESSKYKGLFPALSQVPSPGSPGDYVDVDSGVGKDVIRFIWDNNDFKWVEQTSGAPLTASQIKGLYETNPDTNSYSDQEKAKLASLENYNDSSLKSRVDSLESSSSITEGKVSSLEASSSVLEQKISSLELASSSLGEDIVTINEDLEEKVDKEVGKGLSSNDFTDLEKQKLDDVISFEDSLVFASKLSGLDEGVNEEIADQDTLKTILEKLQKQILELKAQVEALP